MKRDEDTKYFTKSGTPRSLPKPAQYHSMFIESSAKNKATSNDIDIDTTVSTVLLRKTSTSTPPFLINEVTFRTGGVTETRTAKEIKKNQHNRAYIDHLVESTIICSEEDDMKSYDLSTVSEEE